VALSVIDEREVANWTETKSDGYSDSMTGYQISKAKQDVQI
jgi:hypothetical protein